ncbi:MAG: 50S ribosome-binding GTPase [Planctomycetota bacterium]|nr:50S ribosome-binding GTPase [Planctomycetota bacterium]
MTHVLTAPTMDHTPDAALGNYIAAAAARIAPVPVDSGEGKHLYRALACHVWCRHQRPVSASDIRDLWERIDSIKRGAPVGYALCGIHFWAAEYANSLAADTVSLDPEHNQRLAAWLGDWPNVCILGQIGRGKSSTVNRLFGVKVAEISHHTACTATVSDYRLVTGSFLNRPTGIVLWDVPGFGDERWPWDRYVKLYRRLARKCDVVVFMLDNDRLFHMDFRMLKKLRKQAAFETKLVVAINKADLFHPCNWDAKAHAPSPEMQETIEQRVAVVAEHLGLTDSKRVVPISALKNWNVFGLLTAMVDASGESKGAVLLRAVRPDGQAPEGAANQAAEAELGKRFGIGAALRSHFRSVLS